MSETVRIRRSGVPLSCLATKYAQVTKMLGNARLEAMCFDGVTRICHIRGSLRRKVWINTSDIILIDLRGYQDNKADVILKYNAAEARSLKAYGKLPEYAEHSETDTFDPEDDDEIQFKDTAGEDEDIEVRWCPLQNEKLRSSELDRTLPQVQSHTTVPLPSTEKDENTKKGRNSHQDFRHGQSCMFGRSAIP
ncbi:eukaryotic translation initiation factor 1A-like [Moschus berezovskii]|uniref:eukaryotic translation initiation factor 1A-like n=1 Tax=Moschus berezovskii TaxID=68408 RepID=UPI00244513E7|nr:eukaryotic translation initiation factor 1A-like [Moschus berezovskii]